MKILIVVGSLNVFLALDIYHPLLYLHDYLITVLLLIILSTVNSEILYLQKIKSAITKQF